MKISFKAMPKHYRQILWYRVVEETSITDVAQKFGLSWDEADQLIESGLMELKKVYLKNERTMNAKSR